MMPEISVVCVNYNEKKVTLEFLNSLLDQQVGDIEIIVVDNSSDSEEKLQENDHILKPVIIYSKNKGYAAALNAGIKHTSSSLLLLVNNDILLETNSLRCFLDFFREHPEVDAASPVIFRAGMGTCDYAGYSPINPYTGRNHAITSRPKEPMRTTPYLHGACMIVRRRVFDAGITLPEVYFLYYEEMEWSFRLHKAGFKLVVPAKCGIKHRHSASTSKNKELQHYFLTRNRILFMRRTVTGTNFIIFLLYILIISTPYNILRLLAKGKPSLIRSHIRAIAWNMNPKNSIE